MIISTDDVQCFSDLAERLPIAIKTLSSASVQILEFLDSKYRKWFNIYDICKRFKITERTDLLRTVDPLIESHGVQFSTRHSGEFEAKPDPLMHDKDLELEFRRVCDGQNSLNAQLPFNVIIADKQCNSSGLQLADLVARPIGRKTLKPEQPNRAYDILATKFAADANDQGPTFSPA